MIVTKLTAGTHFAIAGYLFFKGDYVFIETDSHRNPGSSVDYWRVYNIDREYVGNLACDWFDTGFFER